MRHGADSTFGAVTRVRTIGGLDVFEVCLSEQLKLPFHVHPTAQVCIVLEGTYAEEVRGQQRTLEPGGVLFRPAGELHRNEVGAHKVRTLLVDFEPARFASLELDQFLTRPAYFSPGLLWSSIQGLESELESAIATEGIILLTVARAARMLRRSCEQKVPAWLERASKIIHTCYREKIGLSSVASEVKVHPVTLASAFRRYHGTTVEKYILRLRLEEARQLLLESDRSLSQIAQDLGFCDQSHLGKAFKRQYRVSPRIFRSSARSTNFVPKFR